MSRVGKSVDIESRRVVARGGENGDWLLLGVGFLFGVMKCSEISGMAAQL